MIYLDAASTANYKNIDNLILETMLDAMRNDWQNPSSLYATDVKKKINKSRKNIAEFIGAKSEEIYFTSGASESNNWAIRGWVDKQHMHGNICPVIITTPIEHKSTLKSVQNEVLGARVIYCDINEDGLVNLQNLSTHLDDNECRATLVSVSFANNEIGTIQNIKQVSNLVHKYNGILHVDATQALGHIPIDVKELGIDMMSASGHKISPILKGVGFLYKRNGINIQPLIYGSQESGLRGGTENTFGIIGLGEAVKYCNISEEYVDEMCRKRDYFIDLLKTKFGCELNGHPMQRLPNNVNVVFPQNITGEALLYNLDYSNIKISTGSACNSQEIVPSYVLKTIGLSDENTMRTVRFTLSDDITYEDIDYVINEIDKVIRIIEE